MHMWTVKPTDGAIQESLNGKDDFYVTQRNHSEQLRKDDFNLTLKGDSQILRLGQL
jgi:hypothetical protein